MQKKKKKWKKPVKHQKRKAKRLSTEQLEKQAQEDLAEKKFKQARYGFQELYRLDQEKYLSELLESNYGLARNLIKKGQLTDADNVIANIKTLTGDKSEGVLDVLVAIKKRDYGTACRIFANLISQESNISNIKKTPDVADAFILAFEDFPQLKISCPGIYEEIIAVQHALENISAEKFDDAWSGVKKVSVNSIFSHWKMFVKGLIAFYTKEDIKAISAFKRIPTDSLLQSIAGRYVVLLGDSSTVINNLEENALQEICVTAGRPDLVPILPRANYLWKVGRYRDSYWHIRDGLKPFPSENTGVTGILTRFYFNNILHLPKKPAKKYLEGLKNRIKKSSSKANIEDLLIKRVECLLYDTMPTDDAKYIKIWESFLEMHTELYGNNNKLEALVYTHLGKIFSAETLKAPPLFFWEPLEKDICNLRNAQLAEQYFGKSITSDKGNKDAYLGLLYVYEKTKNKSKENKLLDKLAPAFPDDQIIIARAGMGCIERKAFIKGTKYLEQANILDPLDRTIKERLAVAYLHTARNYYKKGNVKQGREIYQKALKNGAAGRGDHNLGHAYIYARWAALEFKNNNENIGVEKFRLSMEEVENTLPVLYFTQLIYRENEVPDVYTGKVKILIDKEWKKPPATAMAVSLIKIYSYMILISQPIWLSQEKKRVVKYTLDAVGKPCSRDDALYIVNFGATEGNEMKLCNKYTKKMLKQDKEDPRFLYLKYTLSRMDDFDHPSNKTDINELKRILHIAEKRNEIDLVKDLKKTIEEFDRISEIPDIFGDRPPFDIFDDDNDEFDDDFDFGDMGRGILDVILEDMFLQPVGGSKKKKDKKRK
ncbi:MAG: tetratricopeptide repeat protein [Candidatus Scalindua sp.]